MGWILLIGFLVIAAVAFWARPRGEREAVQQSEHWKRISAGAIVLDVRTIREFNSGHIEGALNIPHTELEERLHELGSDRSRTIVAYCAVGGRSETAKRLLLAKGFERVYNAGGYSDLVNSKP